MSTRPYVPAAQRRLDTQLSLDKIIHWLSAHPGYHDMPWVAMAVGVRVTDELCCCLTRCERVATIPSGKGVRVAMVALAPHETREGRQRLKNQVDAYMRLKGFTRATV